MDFINIFIVFKHLSNGNTYLMQQFIAFHTIFVLFFVFLQSHAFVSRIISCWRSGQGLLFREDHVWSGESWEASQQMSLNFYLVVFTM